MKRLGYRPISPLVEWALALALVVFTVVAGLWILDWL